MPPISRSRHRLDVIDAAGIPCGLVSERLSLRVGGGAPAGLGGAYDRPVAVVRGGSVIPIRDFVMIARYAGLLAVTLAKIVGVIRR